VFAVMVATLMTAAVLNASTMLERAETSPLGAGRERALAFWRPLDAFSSSLGLDRPRAGIDALRSPDPVTTPDTSLVAANVLGHEPLTTSPPPVRPELGDLHRTTTTEGGGVPAGPSTNTSLTGSATPLGLPVPGAVRPAPPPPPPTTSGFPLRQPTAEDPLEVVIIGDSTVEPLGNSMLRLLAETGVTEASLDYRVSTGLARPDFFDWPAHLAELQAADPGRGGPEVAVVMLGANDAQPFIENDVVLSFGTDEWITAYRHRVGVLLDQLTADGRWVIWVSQPLMRNPDFDAKMASINAVVASEAEGRPRVRFIDSSPALSDGGRYASYLLDDAGDQQLVRQNDGIHLTPAGGDRLAPIVVEELDSVAPLS
jgi:lysophospholipase L1-like esterase